MRIMTRMGTPALRSIEESGSFVKAVHSVGAPLSPGQADVPWACNSLKYISHFPETREIWSYRSGYGGDAPPGDERCALRGGPRHRRRERRRGQATALPHA